MDKVLTKVDSERSEVARGETKSILRNREYPGICTFTFDGILTEMENLCPTVFKFLFSIMQLHHCREKNVAPLCLIYALVVVKRCHELSRVQTHN